MTSSTAKRKNEWRRRLFDQQGGLCVWCRKPMRLDNRRRNGMPARDFATFEHLTRRRDGGKDGEGNCALSHAKCNRARERMGRP